MVIEIKKAKFEELDRFALALMTMKQSEDCITRDEMYDYIDRTYYLEDENKNILAIVCANRRSIEYSEEATRVYNAPATRYQVKYALFIKQAIEDNGLDATKVMTRLFKELCADLSDWSVWLDVEFQAKVNLGSKEEDTISILTEAALANGFKKAVNRFAYIRVQPINYGSLH